MRRLWLATALLAGCVGKGAVKPPSLQGDRTVRPPLAVCVARDERPRTERVGKVPGTALFFFADVFELTHERGAMLSRSSGLMRPWEGRLYEATRPSHSLSWAVSEGLRRSGAFPEVTLLETLCDEEPPAPTSEQAILWVRLESSWGQRFGTLKRWTYPVFVYGDVTVVDTQVRSSYAPYLGYARATVSYCTPQGCEDFTAVGSAVGHQPQEQRTATSTARSQVNAAHGDALSALAEHIGRRVLDAR